MPNIAEARRPTPRSEAEDARLALLGRVAEASILDGISAAFADTIPAIATRQLARAGYPDDPGWSLDQPTLDRLSTGVDDDLRLWFGEARSEDHAQFIRLQALDQTERRRTLESMGWKGQALRMAASVLDPAYLAAGVATGGMGAVAGAATTTSRMSAAIRSGLVASVPFGMLESYRATQDPSVTEGDVARSFLSGFGFGAATAVAGSAGRAGRFLAGGAGSAAPPVAADTLAAAFGADRTTADILFNGATQFIMGGAFAALPSTKGIRAAADRMQRDIQYAELHSAYGGSPPLTPKGEAYFREQTGSSPQARASRVAHTTADPLVEPRPDLTPEQRGAIAAQIAKEQAAAAEANKGHSVGAASANDPVFRVAPEKPGYAAGDLDLSAANDAKVWASGWLRLRSMPGMVGDSEIPSFRRLNNMVAKDPLAKADGSPSIYSASEWVDDAHSATVARAFTSADANFAGHLKATAKTPASRLTREEFNAEVTKAQRRPKGEYTGDPFIIKQADANRERYLALLQKGQRHGVKGLSEVDANETHVPRIPFKPAKDDLVARFGADALREHLIAPAILRATPEMDPKVAAIIARAWLKRAGEAYDSIDSPGTLFGGLDRHQIEEALRDVAPDATPERLAKAVDFLIGEAEPSEVNTISRAKRRVRMDETYRTTIDGVDVGIEDFLVNDADTLLASYSRSIHGAAGLAEVFRQFSVEGDAIESIPQLLRRLRKDAEAHGLAERDYADDLDRIETMLKLTAGIPLGENTKLVRVARVLRNMNYTRLMSNVGSGIQNFGEIVESMADSGMGAVLNQVPTMGQLFKRAADGSLDNALLRDAEAIGLGAERITHRIHGRLIDESGAVASLNTAEAISARAQRLASDVSLQSVGTTTMNRMVAAPVMQKWADYAASGRLPSAKRLAAVGMDESMAHRVVGELKKHAEKVDGSRLRDLHLEKWDDLEAVSAFRGAISKTVRRLVLRNNATEYAHWMHSETGKFMMQLRTFAYGAWTNKLLFGIQQRDAKAFLGLGVATVGAAMTYVARTYIDSLGHTKREQFLRDRLAGDKIAKAAFSRAAYSSLIPSMVDTVAEGAMGRTVFGYARTTGLQGSLVFGNPTVDWALAAERVIRRSIWAPVNPEYDFSREDVRAIRDGLWIPNVVGVRNVIDQLTKRLPRRSQR